MENCCSQKLRFAYKLLATAAEISFEYTVFSGYKDAQQNVLWLTEKRNSLNQSLIRTYLLLKKKLCFSVSFFCNLKYARPSFVFLSHKIFSLMSCRILLINMTPKVTFVVVAPSVAMCLGH